MKSLAAVAVAVLLSLASPMAQGQESLFGQDANGKGLADGYEDLNGNGVPDGYEGGGPQGNRMEAECLATARPAICLTYFQFNCQYYGFQLACTMASIGGACANGDQQYCRYFSALLEANKDCYLGNPSGCAYLAQQPMLRQ